MMHRVSGRTVTEQMQDAAIVKRSIDQQLEIVQLSTPLQQTLGISGGNTENA